LFRNYIAPFIRQDCGEIAATEEFAVWPAWFFYMPQVNLDPKQRLPWYYECYNPIGGLMVVFFIPTMEKFPSYKTNLAVEDDLFQYILARRLGKDGDLTARAFGQKYIVDIEKKRIYSPGPDGQAFTNDDIWLPIEPNVLGLIPKGQ